MSKVLVTGGAGFIGVAMTKCLLKKGFEVRALDVVKCPVKGAESYIGSIMDPNNVSNAVRGCDYVIHLAAMLGVRRTEIKLLECLNINILGTKNILDACVTEKIKKIVFSSSSEVYGEPAKVPISEEHPKAPKSVYGVSKTAGEEYLKAYKQYYNLDFSIVRFFNVYGPGQVAEFVLPRFVKAVVDGKQPSVYGDGDQVRAFCYVEDAVEGVFLALTHENADSEVFNIGNDTEPITMRDLADRVIKISKKDVTPLFIKMKESDRKAEREIVRRIPDLSKAKEVLGYQPNISLDDGIAKVIENGEIVETWFEPLIK
jgi:UDP-glucose 4-epimerase